MLETLNQTLEIKSTPDYFTVYIPLVAQSEWQLTVDNANELEDDELTDSRDAAAVRQI